MTNNSPSMLKRYYGKRRYIIFKYPKLKRNEKSEDFAIRRLPSLVKACLFEHIFCLKQKQ